MHLGPLWVERRTTAPFTIPPEQRGSIYPGTHPHPSRRLSVVAQPVPGPSPGPSLLHTDVVSIHLLGVPFLLLALHFNHGTGVVAVHRTPQDSGVLGSIRRPGLCSNSNESNRKVQPHRHRWVFVGRWYFVRNLGRVARACAVTGTDDLSNFLDCVNTLHRIQRRGNPCHNGAQKSRHCVRGRRSFLFGVAKEISDHDYSV